MAGLWQDVRYALRTLGRQPGSTLAIVLTLALGIGANTAIFSMVNGVLLRSLPYQESDQLVTLRQHDTGDAHGTVGFSVPDVMDLREQSQTLASVVEYHTMWFNLIGTAEPQRVQTGVVSHEFFDVLGVRPVLGRSFLPGDDDPGAEPVLVLSNGYWKQAFGGDPKVVGRTVEMNDRVHTIVGVLPPVPQYPNENDVYMPTVACPFRRSPSWTENRGNRPLTVFARMEDSATVERARADLASVVARLRSTYPNDYPSGSTYTVDASRLQEELTKKARPKLLVLLATAGFVLLIACANVANLSLVRLSRREQELAVRAAFGAGRGRLTRQLLTESALVALVGGGLGLLLAAGGMDLLASFATRFTPRANEIRLDGAVLTFTVLVSLATGLAFGSFPAYASSERAISSLKEGGRTTSSAATGRVRTALIVAQLALSFVLLVGAGSW